MKKFNQFIVLFLVCNCYYSFSQINKVRLGGLGIIFKIDESSKFPIIVKVIDGSPAQRINLQPNDFITKVGLESTYNLTTDDIANRISGLVGTTCYITVWRGGKEYSVSFIREKINFDDNTTTSQDNSLISWSDFTAEYGTIKFKYPFGWEVGKTNDNLNSAFTENYYIQPKGQYFSAINGQVVIRIIDPVSIMEDTKTLSAAFSVDLFTKMVKQISEDNVPKINTIVNNGRTYFEYISYNIGYTTKIIGSKSINGNLFILAMASAPDVTSTNNLILFTIAESVKGGEPSVVLTSQENTIKNWYSYLSSGNYTELEKISCEAAKQLNSLVELAQQLFGIGGGQNAVKNGAGKFDFSNLRFYTVATGTGLVVIRVCGNVVTPSGEIKSFYNYARYLRGSNLFVVKLENSGWKVCQSISR